MATKRKQLWLWEEDGGTSRFVSNKKSVVEAFVKRNWSNKVVFKKYPRQKNLWGVIWKDDTGNVEIGYISKVNCEIED